MIFFTSILIVLAIAFSSACFTQFYSFIIGSPHSEEFNQGRILSWWGSFILQKYLEKEMHQDIHIRSATSEYLRLLPKDYPEEQMEIDLLRVKMRHKKLNWWKMLGVCPLCFNFYPTAILIVLAILFTPLHWVCILPTLAISHFFVERIMFR